MTRILPLALALLPGAAPGVALAHAGHLGDVAGHDHWVAGAALGAAALAALWAAWKGRGEPEKADEPSGDETEASA